MSKNYFLLFFMMDSPSNFWSSSFFLQHFHNKSLFSFIIFMISFFFPSSRDIVVVACFAANVHRTSFSLIVFFFSLSFNVFGEQEMLKPKDLQIVLSEGFAKKLVMKIEGNINLVFMLKQRSWIFKSIEFSVQVWLQNKRHDISFITNFTVKISKL